MRALVLVMILPLASCAIKDAVDGLPYFVETQRIGLDGVYDTAAGAFNTDAKMDLAVAGRLNGVDTVRVFYSDGNGLLSDVSSLDLRVPEGVSKLAMGDLDGDGANDLAVAMPACLTSVAALASLKKRSTSCLLPENWGNNSFTAALRPSNGCRAAYTTPMPPLPSSETIW